MYNWPCFHSALLLNALAIRVGVLVLISCVCLLLEGVLLVCLSVCVCMEKCAEVCVFVCVRLIKSVLYLSLSLPALFFLSLVVVPPGPLSQ